MEIFDEDKAVEFIQQRLNASECRYDDDDILDIIDIIWDYYEDHGLLDVSMEEDDDDIDRQTLIEHVVKMVRKDKSSKINLDDIPAIVNAELDYENLCDEL